MSRQESSLPPRGREAARPTKAREPLPRLRLPLTGPLRPPECQGPLGATSAGLWSPPRTEGEAVAPGGHATCPGPEPNLALSPGLSCCTGGCALWSWGGSRGTHPSLPQGQGPRAGRPPKAFTVCPPPGPAVRPGQRRGSHPSGAPSAAARARVCSAPGAQRGWKEMWFKKQQTTSVTGLG